jgi:hypothetical protein
MNILMIGQGKGSFEVRGKQLGGALGARVVVAPSDDDIRWADVVVLIKRAAFEWSTLVQRMKKPIVWDALDFWMQPFQNSLDEQQSKALLHSMIRAIRPALVIGATEAMAREAHGVYLPHHHWPGLTPAPARETVSVVGYEGHKKWLGKWGRAVQAECDRRGWQFVLNPEDLRACDILVAFRDEPWDGWMCREWKSGIKLINAMAAGRPVITQPSSAFGEIKALGTIMLDPADISTAFDGWLSKESRDAAASQAVFATRLDTIAERYRQMLQRVAEKAA